MKLIKSNIPSGNHPVRSNLVINYLYRQDGIDYPVATAYDVLYFNRRPRKNITWHLQRRIVRALGDMIEGDYSRLPEYHVDMDGDLGDQTNEVARLLHFRWNRRDRTGSNLAPLVIDLVAMRARLV